MQHRILLLHSVGVTHRLVVGDESLLPVPRTTVLSVLTSGVVAFGVSAFINAFLRD